MNSTADLNNLNLSDSLVDKLYLDANSLHYYSDNEEELKNTIYRTLKSAKQRYWIKEQINEGGIKKIIKARDESTGRDVAMAVLHKCENIHHIEDFLREARITALLQHPGIIPVYDIGLNSLDQPFFTMKLIRNGQSLSQTLKEIKLNRYSGTLNNLNERLELFIKICDAVAYAHSIGIIHLDLKPDNIQLDDFGQVLVCDWGLARLSDRHSDNTAPVTDESSSLDFINLTLNGIIKGTPGYMAPEQATVDKELKDHRTDIYSLGAILYTLLSFRAPIKKGNVKQILNDTKNGIIQPFRPWSAIQTIPESLQKITLRAMALSPDERYQSVQELQSDIKAYLGGFASTVENPSILKLLALFYKRNKLKCNFILVGLVLTGSITSFMFWRLNKSERQARENEKRALLNEQKAVASAERARKSERKLYDSLLKLKYAETKTKDLEKMTLPLKFNKADRLLYVSKNYDETYKLLKEALKTDPNFYSAWQLLVVYAFTAQSFSDTEYYAEQILKLEIDPIIRADMVKIRDLASKYKPLLNPKTERLNQSDFDKLVHDCSIIPRVVTNLLVHRSLNNQLETKPRIIHPDDQVQ